MVVLISTIIVDTVNGDEDDGDDEGDGGAMVRGGGEGGSSRKRWIRNRWTGVCSEVVIRESICVLLGSSYSRVSMCVVLCCVVLCCVVFAITCTLNARHCMSILPPHEYPSPLPLCLL